MTETLNDASFDDDKFFAVIKNLQEVEIPGIIVQKEILKDEDEQAEEDPTLFVRLNSSGTRIAGEELIYSIYKASFPEAKELVENIGASFIAPSLVISLIARLAQAELNDGHYQTSININDFRKRIKEPPFKQKMKELIGDNTNSPSTNLFTEAIALIRSEGVFDIPPVLVKSIIKTSPDLFLMLLQWLKLKGNSKDEQTRKRILATITALHFFCKDKTKFTRDVWQDISTDRKSVV